MIWLLILPSSCYTFPFKLVFENLVLNQDSSFYLTSFNILITCLLNNIRILKGEVSCESLLGVKRLTFHTFQHLTPTAPCSMLTSIFFKIVFTCTVYLAKQKGCLIGKLLWIKKRLQSNLYKLMWSPSEKRLVFVVTFQIKRVYWPYSSSDSLVSLVN